MASANNGNRRSMQDSLVNQINATSIAATSRSTRDNDLAMATTFGGTPFFGRSHAPCSYGEHS